MGSITHESDEVVVIARKVLGKRGELVSTVPGEDEVVRVFCGSADPPIVLCADKTADILVLARFLHVRYEDGKLPTDTDERRTVLHKRDICRHHDENRLTSDIALDTGLEPGPGGIENLHAVSLSRREIICGNGVGVEMRHGSHVLQSRSSGKLQDLGSKLIVDYLIIKVPEKVVDVVQPLRHNPPIVGVIGS